MEILIFIFILYIILFLISIKIKDNSILDIFWSLWFVIQAIYLYIINQDFSLIKNITILIILIWWIRLSYYILKRKLKDKSEDPRYAEWRKKWKYFYTRSFFQVFMLQILLMFIISTPIYIIFSWKDINFYVFIIWITISIIWLLFEIISDSQVKKYIKENWKNNKVFTWWLYKYSRNPNYFWESTFWLWIAIISSSISIYGFIWYIVITTLLLFVSWVPMKEKRQSKKENWNQYKEKTSVFIPWFPKK